MSTNLETPNGWKKPAAGKEPQPDGSEFEEITWKRAFSLSPDENLSAFRNSYNPRIADTEDMISTGTGIAAPRGSALFTRGATSQSPTASRDNPPKIVFFMHSVTSNNFFEQMKWRGVRLVSDTETEQVNPGIKRETRLVTVVDRSNKIYSARWRKRQPSHSVSSCSVSLLANATKSIPHQPRRSKAMVSKIR